MSAAALIAPVGPAELARPLPRTRKARLVAEVLRAYLRVRWSLLGGSELLPTVALARRGASGRAPEAEGVDPHRVGLRLGWAVVRTLRLLPTDSRCLTRSLVLTALLARRGISSSLVIGVQAGPDFAAHAWVEHEGRPLLDSGAGAFKQLVVI